MLPRGQGKQPKDHKNHQEDVVARTLAAETLVERAWIAYGTILGAPWPPPGRILSDFGEIWAPFGGPHFSENR